MGIHYTSCCRTGETHLAADSYSLPLKERPNIRGQAGELFLERAISFPCTRYHRYVVLAESIHELEISTSLQYPSIRRTAEFPLVSVVILQKYVLKKPFRHLQSTLSESVLNTHHVLVAKTVILHSHWLI